MAGEIYLDNAMTTRPSERSIAKMMPLLEERWGHPSSPHRMGHLTASDIREALGNIYALLGAERLDHFVFTSSGAEAVNQVINSAYFDHTLESGKNHLITSNIDEASAIMAIGRLEEINCVGKMVDACEKGFVTASAIADAFTPRTAMVSLSWANGLTGVLNPVSEIGALCRDRGASFHLDATHLLGRLPLDIEESLATHITFNGDNMHAPKGCGGVLVKAGRRMSPLIVGGIEQAGGRAGSYSVALLAALGEAAKEAEESVDFLCTEVARLRNKLEEGVVGRVPDALPLFAEEERVPHIAAIAFPAVCNEALLHNLNRRGLYASIGGGSFQQIGLVLEACGVSHRIAHTAVSFALSRETKEEEIDRAITIISEEVTALKRVSNRLFSEG